MAVIKNLLPILILLVGSIYAYQKYELIPESVTSGLTFLPHLLAIMVIGLSIHFHRSQIFFYAVVLIAANVIIQENWASSGLGYSLLASFAPLLILILSIFPDRGIASVRALPAYAVMLVALGFSIYAVRLSPPWVSAVFLSDWLPPQYFDWTPLTQTVLMIYVFSLFYMLILCIIQPSPRIAAGFGITLLLIIQLHFGKQYQSLIVLSSTALLMCLYAVMQESWRMAYLDELTGLPARRALKEKFERIGGLYTVAMLDVDHFKKFNDTFGHDAGDAVLRMIAGKLDKVTGGGICYRYGGEEFTVLFPGRECADARPHLEQLRKAIQRSRFVIQRAERRGSQANPKKSKPVTVTASIGIADSKSDVSSPWDVLKLADKALYRAKGKGRNCVCD